MQKPMAEKWNLIGGKLYRVHVVVLKSDNISLKRVPAPLSIFDRAVICTVKSAAFIIVVNSARLGTTTNELYL